MNNPINDGGPAFPHVEVTDAGKILNYNGMSLRAHFAGEAIKGLLANAGGNRHWGAEQWAECAVEQADALIAELNKTAAK